MVAHQIKYLFFISALFFIVSGCNRSDNSDITDLDDIASHYVELALEIGQYHPDFIDAYYGPEDWNPKQQIRKALPYEELKWKTTSLINELNSFDDMSFGEHELLRYQFLVKQLQAIRTKLDILSGQEYPFDVESLRLYDVVAPHTDMAVYDTLLIKLDSILPGNGSISERYYKFSSGFIIPPAKLDTVFQIALMEAKRRVKQYIKLPDGENFELEFVNDKPWSGYNWYKGNFTSLIQINIDLPIHIDKALELACHEGYPGHHVYNILLEQKLVKERNWKEYQVYPLFTPQSFIAEGSAHYGVEMTFSQKERIEFEKNILFPLAGLEPSRVEEFYKVQSLRKDLKHSINDIARMYINREIDSENAVKYLIKYLQYTEEGAYKQLDFFNRYGSYIINYSLGEEMIRARIENESDEVSEKWRIFEEIISTPRTASTL